MRELLFMSLFCEKIAENVGYAENAFERIKEAIKNMLGCFCSLMRLIIEDKSLGCATKAAIPAAPITAEVPATMEPIKDFLRPAS